MKRLISALLALVLLASGACLAAQDTDSDVEAMLPVLDSVMRAMIERNCAYAPDYADYYWTTLCMLAVNWNIDDALCEVVDNELRVPRKLMEEFAVAAFYNLDALPPISDDFTLARYDEAWDAYMVSLGDVGDSYTYIANYEYNEDGTVMVNVVMGSHDEPVLYSMLSTLAPNPNGAGYTYAYSVTEGILSEVGPDVRIHTVSMEGEEEYIIETRYVSPYGYEIWYDAEMMMLNSADGDGYDEFVPAFPDALPSVSLTIMLADVPDDEAGSLLDEIVAEYTAAGWKMTEIRPDELDSGLPCMICEGSDGNVVIRLYSFEGALGLYCVTASFPEEATEGFGKRLDIMVKTLTDEV